MSIVERDEFIEFCKAFDYDYTAPGIAKICFMKAYQDFKESGLTL